MTAFLIARLPLHSKSLEAVKFMQRNDFFFRISSNSSFLELLMSSKGVEERFATAFGLLDEFKLGDEEKQLIQLFSVTEVKEEVDSDDEHQLKNNVVSTEVKEEVESDVEQDDVRAIEEGDSDGRHPRLEKSPVAVHPVESVENSIVVPRNPTPLMDVEQADDDVVDDHQKDREGEMNSFFNQDMDDDEDKGSAEEREESDEQQSVLKKRSGRPSGNTVGRLLFVCPFKKCPSNYKKYEELEEHMKIHPDKQNFFCDVCKKDFSSKDAAMAHIQERKKKKCCACGKRFPCFFTLVQHLRCHTGEKPFVCETCDQKFAHSCNLKNHMLIHTGKKKFSCGFCKKNFTYKEDLKRHERTHSGEKPYKCTQCDFRCAQIGNLKTHNLVHTGDKSYPCGYCEKRFSHKHVLKSHELTHTGEKPFECKECGRSFSHKHHLTYHIRIHTGQKPFSCTKCDKKFTRNGTLNDHMKNKHQA